MFERNRIFICGAFALFCVITLAAGQVKDVLTKSVKDIQVVKSVPYSGALPPVVEGIRFADTSASRRWVITSDWVKAEVGWKSAGVSLATTDGKKKFKVTETWAHAVRSSPTRDEFLCILYTRWFVSSPWNVGTVWLIDTTGARRKLFDYDGGLHWSPDGEKIMIAGGGCSYDSIAVVVVDRFAKRLFIDEGVLDEFEPGGVWAPDNRHIAYAKETIGRMESDGTEFTIKSEIVLADIKTGDKKILIPNSKGVIDYPLRWDTPNRLLIKREVSDKGWSEQYLYWILK